MNFSDVRGVFIERFTVGSRNLISLNLTFQWVSSGYQKGATTNWNANSNRALVVAGAEGVASPVDFEQGSCINQF